MPWARSPPTPAPDANGSGHERGARPTPRRRPSDPLETVVHQCHDGDVLVVLDNAEHLIEAVAAVAQRLLVECRRLRLLVTSREPLGVPGEVVWRIPSLAVPDVSRAEGPASLTAFDSVRL